jgi:uncharacterized oxidoreductase
MGDLGSNEEAGVTPMSVKALAQHAIDGTKRIASKIRPDRSSVLKPMSRVAPNLILNRLSKSVDPMLAQSESKKWSAATEE